MAWNRRELARFLDSVEKIGHVAIELENQLDRIKGIEARRAQRRKAAPSVDGAEKGGDQ
jgi:hypothetical protein